MRSGWHADQVRVLWSAADIAFLTIELKLFEEIRHRLGRSMRSCASRPPCSWAIPS